VFWVHASNRARFEQSFRDMAERVKIAGRQDPQANIFQLVHDWLCDCKQQWLLVLDNVDDTRFLLDVQANGDNQGQTTNAQVIQEPLREYLPHCERGSILVTTRNKAAALRLVELRDIIVVEPMNKSQAIELCEKKLGAQGGSLYNRTDAAELAAALDYMPLAIVQAVAYILRRAPRCSMAKYVDEYKKSERKKTTLLDYDEGQLRRDSGVSNSIIVTWQISFEYIQQTRPSAADLLSLMSFFDRQGIPEDLLRSRGERIDHDSNERLKAEARDNDEEDNTSQSSASNDESRDDTLEDDVVALRDFCFISCEKSGTSFEMHALVQLAMRKWLEANSKLERWKQQFINNLCVAFPTGEYENWAACQALFAHARSAAGQPPEDQLSLVKWASLLYRAAWYATKIGNITDAVTLAMKSTKARKKVLGEEHEGTLSSMAMTGLAYSNQGRWKDAEKLLVQVMEACKTKLGADHPSTLTSMSNLASTYRSQGRWKDAEKLFVQVIETRKTKLGADHPDTLGSMNNLASTYSNQGRWKDAEKLFVQVIEACKSKLRVDYPSTLTSMSNLALTYSN
jgi:tetratricopeptide (TPR) repeat protein